MRSIALIARVLVIAIVALFILRFAASAQQPAQPPDMPIDAATRTTVIDNLIKELNAGYVFPEIAKKTGDRPPRTPDCPKSSIR